MKKGMALLLCGGLLVSLSGCGKEEAKDEQKKDVKPKLVCKMNETEFGTSLEMKVEIEYNKEGTLVENSKMTMSMELEEEADVESIKKEGNSMCDEENSIYTNCNTTVDGKKVSVTADFDIEKMGDEFKKDTPIEDMKNEILKDETENATCEIIK